MNRATPRITIRPKPDIEARLRRVMDASKRTATSLVLESIEARLPILERQNGIKRKAA